MNYTPIHSAYLGEIRDSLNPFALKMNPSWRTSWFAQKKLGITPYKYQHILWKSFHNDKRVIITKSRQIGVSTAIEIFALDCAVNNLYPSGMFNNTKIGIVSNTDDQAKKVLRDIRAFMRMGDEFLGGQFFKEQISDDKSMPNNAYTITFKNKSAIMCFPPTEKIRGYPLDLVFVDESAFIEDEDIFDTAIYPTISKTGGKIILASTPAGQRGFFFEKFDPFDRYKIHEYVRFWFFWKQCEDEQQLKLIRQKYKIALETGNLKKFEQEYNAKFTIDESAFYNSEDVDKGCDKSLAIEYEWRETPCVLSIDYGMSKSETSLTIKTKFKGKAITLFQWARADFDLNLLLDDSFEHSVPNLWKRYPIYIIIVDDCPEGYQTNQQLENLGYPVRRVDFKGGEKNRAFCMHRSALKKEIIKYPDIRELKVQMKQLMEINMKVHTFIEKPKDGLDDRIVGEVLASLPLIEEEGNFESMIIEAKPISLKEQFITHRTDEQYQNILASMPDIATLVAEHNRKILEKNARE